MSEAKCRLPLMEIASLRQYCKSAGGKSEAITHFGPAHHDEGAGGRYLIKIGHNFDLIVAVLQDVSLGIHLVRGIGIHTFVAGRRHAAPLVKEFDCFERPSGKRAALEMLPDLNPNPCTCRYATRQRRPSARAHVAVPKHLSRRSKTRGLDRSRGRAYHRARPAAK